MIKGKIMSTLDINNVFQTDLFLKNVIQPYLKEYLNCTNFGRFMGGADSIIYKKMEAKHEGSKIVFPLRQTVFPKVALGEEQLEGNESELNYVTDHVEIDWLRYATRITKKQLVEIQTKFVIDQDIRNDLLAQAELLLTRRILGAFAGNLYNATIPMPLINNPDFYNLLKSRILTANFDLANGPRTSRSRVVIGAGLQIGASNTFANALTNANVPNDATGVMTVAHIRALFQMATSGYSVNPAGNVIQESAIRPFKYDNKRGFEDKRYCLFMSPSAYTKLAQDNAWQLQVSRGTVENEIQPSALYGTMYKGTIEGVMVIVIPEFENLKFTNPLAANEVFAYSVLCGASAIGFAMGNIPTFMERSSTDYGMHHGLSWNEISGIKALAYPSKSDGIVTNNTNLVPYGIINSFTRLG